MIEEQRKLIAMTMQKDKTSYRGKRIKWRAMPLATIKIINAREILRAPTNDIAKTKQWGLAGTARLDL